MFFAKTLLSLLAASATLVNGASIKRQDGDNGSCAALQRQCVGSVQNSLSNVWAIEACLFAGVCYERNGGTLDNFLASLWNTEGNTGNPPTSLNTPRVTQAVSDSFSLPDIDSPSLTVLFIQRSSTRSPPTGRLSLSRITSTDITSEHLLFPSSTCSGGEYLILCNNLTH